MPYALSNSQSPIPNHKYSAQHIKPQCRLGPQPIRIWLILYYGAIYAMCTLPYLVTVKVKVDSSLLIKISVSIKVVLVLVEGFSLLQNLNINSLVLSY
jgi:hypothetical protein